ncbi:uncharacterized protein LOC102804845 [Saccoglossus kowalevskii]
MDLTATYGKFPEIVGVEILHRGTTTLTGNDYRYIQRRCRAVPLYNLKCDYYGDVLPYFDVCTASDTNELIFPSDDCYFNKGFIKSLSFTASVITSSKSNRNVEAEMVCRAESTLEGYDFELWMCKESAGEAHLLNCMCPHSAKIPKLFNRTTSYEVSLNYRITIYDNSSDSYFCLVQYSGGKWVHGILEPHITEQPENITVSAGASSTLRCESSGFPPPHIKWMKSGHELGFFDNSRFVTMSSDDVSWLNINETLPQDEGVYNCIATNILGQATSTDAELTVMTDAMPTGELLIEPPDQPELSMGMIFAVIGGSLAVVIMIISGIICYIRRRHRKQIVHIHGNVSANNFTVNAENDAAVRILGDVAIGHENLGDKLEAEADVNLNNLKQ